MAKFVGNMIISLALVVGGILFLRTLPDIARYVKLREM